MFDDFEEFVSRLKKETEEGKSFVCIDAERGQIQMVGGPRRVQVEVLPHGEGLELPAYSTGGALGLDLRAATSQWLNEGVCVIEPGEAHKIPTGICIAVPPFHAGLVLSRSGLAAKHQVAITNAPGLIDPDYRGEVFLLLENRGQDPFTYRRGDRLGQLLIVPAPPVRLEVVDELDATDRGAGGLGSTGVSS